MCWGLGGDYSFMFLAFGTRVLPIHLSSFWHTQALSIHLSSFWHTWYKNLPYTILANGGDSLVLWLIVYSNNGCAQNSCIHYDCWWTVLLCGKLMERLWNSLLPLQDLLFVLTSVFINRKQFGCKLVLLYKASCYILNKSVVSRTHILRETNYY